MEDYNQIYSGTQIAKLRSIRGFDSEKKLADELGVSQQSIQQIESGKKKISLKMLAELRQLLDTSADYLLGFNEEDYDQKPLAVDDLKISYDAKEALKKIVSRHPANREALSTFIESEEFSELIDHLRALETTVNTYQQLTAPFLISRYGYSPGESIEDPINQIRLLRLEIEDCITHYLESEYHYSEIKKDLQHNIDLAIAAIEAEEEKSDGIP